MKTNKKLVVVFVMFLTTVSFIQAQYGNGYGYGRYGGYGRQRNAIPQAESTPEKKDPPTAEEIVNAQMPKISETLELNEFEKAVVSTILIKYIKKRMQLQLLELEPDKARAAAEEIQKDQDSELEQGLPKEKYDAFVELQKEGFKKMKKKKKKKRKSKQ